MTLQEKMQERLDALKAERDELLRQMEMGQARLNAFAGAISELENWLDQFKQEATPEE